MYQLAAPSPSALRSHQVDVSVDRVAGDKEMTAFKQTLRLRQAMWRESLGLPIGTRPIRPTAANSVRPLGSRIEVEFAHESMANFLSPEAAACARERVAARQLHQTLWVDRLYADLLSSMPMCFNLFGPVARDRAILQAFVSDAWPDVPGRAASLGFEWSPGRRLEGRFLENRSAFDATIHLDLGEGRRGVLGIETKYHEHCRAEEDPSESRLKRYRLVSERSGVFKSHAVEKIVGTPLQQIWLDHLLALSMLQDEEEGWDFARFVLVHPAGNTSFESAAQEYRELLADEATFECRTTEELVRLPSYPKKASEAFRNRYEGPGGSDSP